MGREKRQESSKTDKETEGTGFTEFHNTVHFLKSHKAARNEKLNQSRHDIQVYRKYADSKIWR